MNMPTLISKLSSPMIWGAAFACAFGGAVAGTALGSTPMLAPGQHGDLMMNTDDGSLFDQASFDMDLPNHYPLVTPRGTVPVERLSDRGLYSQVRYRAMYYADSFDNPELADYHIDTYRGTQEEPQFARNDESYLAGAQSSMAPRRDRSVVRSTRAASSLKAPVVVTKGDAAPVVALSHTRGLTIPTTVAVAID